MLLRVLLTGCRERAGTREELGAGGIRDGEVSAQLGGELLNLPLRTPGISIKYQVHPSLFGAQIFNYNSVIWPKNQLTNETIVNKRHNKMYMH